MGGQSRLLAPPSDKKIPEPSTSQAVYDTSSPSVNLKQINNLQLEALQAYCDVFQNGSTFSGQVDSVGPQTVNATGSPSMTLETIENLQLEALQAFCNLFENRNTCSGQVDSVGPQTVNATGSPSMTLGTIENVQFEALQAFCNVFENRNTCSGQAPLNVDETKLVIRHMQKVLRPLIQERLMAEVNNNVAVQRAIPVVKLDLQPEYEYCIKARKQLWNDDRQHHLEPTEGVTTQIDPSQNSSS